MKKFLSFFLVAILLFLSACNTHTPNDTDATTEGTTTESTFTDISESNTTETTSISFLYPRKVQNFPFSPVQGLGGLL